MHARIYMPDTCKPNARNGVTCKPAKKWVVLRKKNQIASRWVTSCNSSVPVNN